MRKHYSDEQIIKIAICLGTRGPVILVMDAGIACVLRLRSRSRDLETDDFPGMGRRLALESRAVRRRRLEGSELEEHLEAVTRALVRAFSPERVILFGSFARGDQNRASDLDLVIVAETDLGFCERIGTALAACAAVSTRTPVEVLVYTPREWQRMQREGSSFAAHVIREGRILHEREPQPTGGPALAPAGPA